MTEIEMAALRIALKNAVMETIRFHGLSSLKNTSLFNSKLRQSSAEEQSKAA